MEIVIIVGLVAAILVLPPYWRSRGSRREPMTDWKKFALLIFGLVALGAVAWVFLTIKGDLGRML